MYDRNVVISLCSAGNQNSSNAVRTFTTAKAIIGKRKLYVKYLSLRLKSNHPDIEKFLGFKMENAENSVAVCSFLIKNCTYQSKTEPGDLNPDPP